MPICCDQCQAFNLSLCNKQTIKGIAMMERQMPKPRCVEFVYTRDWNPVRSQYVHDVA